jgi:hypothetical protein
LRLGYFEKLVFLVAHFGPFFKEKFFFLLYFYENPSKVLGYQEWDKILVITLISSQKSPTPNISPTLFF